jgi:hypothetical protein
MVHVWQDESFAWTTEIFRDLECWQSGFTKIIVQPKKPLLHGTYHQQKHENVA